MYLQYFYQLFAIYNLAEIYLWFPGGPSPDRYKKCGKRVLLPCSNFDRNLCCLQSNESVFILSSRTLNVIQYSSENKYSCNLLRCVMDSHLSFPLLRQGKYKLVTWLQIHFTTWTTTITWRQLSWIHNTTQEKSQYQWIEIQWYLLPIPVIKRLSNCWMISHHP